jgi:hypothetical protein
MRDLSRHRKSGIKLSATTLLGGTRTRNAAMSALLRGRFDAAAKARAVADLQSAISKMEQLMSALNRFIAQEGERMHVRDATRYA